MRTYLQSFLVSLLITVAAQAQYIVYDPAIHNQSMANHAAEIAKFVEIINHQVEQINTLNSQLQEVQHYIELFGDPGQIATVIGADGLLLDLQKASQGQAWARLHRHSDADHGQTYDAGGLYRYLGPTFRTPGGSTLPREQLPYRAFAAIHKVGWNYTNVLADVTARRAALKEQIRQATSQLEASTTDAETQKLSGVIAGLNAALSAVDRESDQALGLVILQDAENRNFNEKYAQARKEEQQAEFTEAMTRFGQTFRLSSEPAVFPEQ